VRTAGAAEGRPVNCKKCNTRLMHREEVCPNCGRSQVGAHLGDSSSSPARLPEPPEFDPEEPERAADEALAKAGLEVPAESPRTRPAPSEGLDPRELREFLARQPESLDRGLSIHCDAQGRAVGVGFSTAVGDIDLLARDGSGAYVVVLIAGPEDPEGTVAAVLQRMGWVRKHVANGKGRVRGIVLVDEPPESLSYAAAAVADTVAFMTWRFAITFVPIEI
jgi:hypothetical protein